MRISTVILLNVTRLVQVQHANTLTSHTSVQLEQEIMHIQLGLALLMGQVKLTRIMHMIACMMLLIMRGSFTSMVIRIFHLQLAMLLLATYTFPLRHGITGLTPMVERNNTLALRRSPFPYQPSPARGHASDAQITAFEDRWHW